MWQKGQVTFFLLLLIGVWLLLFQAMLVFAHVLVSYKHVQFAANSIANAGVAAYGKTALPVLKLCLEEKMLALPTPPAEGEEEDFEPESEADAADQKKAFLKECLEESDELDEAEDDAKKAAQDVANDYNVQLDQKEWKKDTARFHVNVSDAVDYSAGKYFSKQQFHVNAESQLVLDIP